MNRMKELREELNISKAQVARDLNMAYTTYVNYEKETREPNSEVLILVANYFHVSVDYLIGRTDIKIETTEHHNKDLFKCTPHEKEVVIAYRKRPDMQAAVDTLLGVPAEQSEKFINSLANITYM